jgi:hypothetical protein
VFLSKSVAAAAAGAVVVVGLCELLLVVRWRVHLQNIFEARNG